VQPVLLYRFTAIAAHYQRLSAFKFAKSVQLGLDCIKPIDMVNNLSSAPHYQERSQALQRAVFESSIWARGWHTTVIAEELASFYKTLPLSAIIICEHG
jgi:hypothetical protein